MTTIDPRRQPDAEAKAQSVINCDTLPAKKQRIREKDRGRDQLRWMKAASCQAQTALLLLLARPNENKTKAHCCQSDWHFFFGKQGDAVKTRPSWLNHCGGFRRDV
jgi:hypothetical protein